MRLPPAGDAEQNKGGMSMAKVLIVEDERALSLALAAAVRAAGALTDLAPTAALAGQRLQEAEPPYAAMILDIGLPDQNGLRFLAQIPEERRPPVLVITAHGEIDNAISARKLGVREFFPKPLDFDAFKHALQRLLRQSDATAPPLPARSSAYIGAAPSMRPVFQQIAHACASDVPVLITGETGSGRSLTAELIHRNCARAAQPLVQLRPGGTRSSCELTAAWGRAGSGVLLLDDVAQLSAESQAELVRLWEADGPGSPRILAISLGGLREAVERGLLRSDLFYRLQVLEVRLPSLRKRGEDLPALFSFFLAQFDPGRSIAVDEAVLDQLRGYDWPGNLRELRNVASYALTVSGGSGTIQPLHLPGHLGAVVHGEPERLRERLEQAADEWLNQFDEWPPYRDLAGEWERLLISRLLPRFEGKLARLAGSLQANRTTLRKKLRE